MDLKEAGVDVEWIHLAQDETPVASFCEDSNDPLCSVQEGELLDQLSDY
jgi:hypothetical protein